MSSALRNLPAAAGELLSPAARVESRGLPRLLRLACWGVLLGTAASAGLTACEVDVVAAADGGLVPVAPPERHQAWHKSVLRNVRVAVGQKVPADELLGELEPTVAAADRDALTRQRDGLRVQSATLASAAADPAAPVPDPAATDPPERAAALRLAARRRAEFVAGREYRAGQVAEARQARDAAAQKQRRLKTRVELMAEREEMAKKGSIATSRTERIQAELDRRDAASQLADAGGAEADWQAKLGTREADLTAFAEGWRRSAAEQLAAIKRELSNVCRELARAEQTTARIALRSERAGVVVEVPASAAGSTVPEGARLFAVVPLDSPLVVEADLRAADAPRVRPGCEVRVKLDRGFPYPTHGCFVGRVEHVSPHSVAPAEPADGSTAGRGREGGDVPDARVDRAVGVPADPGRAAGAVPGDGGARSGPRPAARLAGRRRRPCRHPPGVRIPARPAAPRRHRAVPRTVRSIYDGSSAAAPFGSRVAGRTGVSHQVVAATADQEHGQLLGFDRREVFCRWQPSR